MAAQRIYGLRFKDHPFHDGSFVPQSDAPSRAFPFHYLDGVSFWMSPEELSPDDEWLGESVRQHALDENAEPGDGGQGGD